MPSVAARVREYLATHPNLLAALGSGVANTSAVARVVARDLGLPRSKAVLSACRRVPRSAAGERHDRKLRRLLRHCRILTRTHVGTVLVSAGAVELRTLADVVAGMLREDAMVRFIQGGRTVLVVLDEDSVERVTSKLTPAQILSVKRNLTEVSISGPPEFDRTPGVVALLTSALAAQGVNIFQGMMFPIDIIFLVANEDSARAVDTFARLLREARAPALAPEGSS
ncbi:MAG TPA: ACT domain-containing protein [Thermoplasmata archaeon]|nr:ACT domain-containing protein [Thermoplasmata archaeon]